MQLEKGPVGLGMSLTGNNEVGDANGAFIANLNPGGAAQKSGKLKTGDKIIRVSLISCAENYYHQKLSIDNL